MAVSPYYTIHRYREDIYKVVAFKGVRDRDIVIHRDKEEHNVNDVKLSNNMSRARSMVLQYALCNPWDYFFTCTLDEKLRSRSDLGKFTIQLPQWIRDRRKEYGTKIQYLLVPQLHEKYNAWHMHGLLSCIPDDKLAPFGAGTPWSLRSKGFLNWPDYQRSFGFCSMAHIRDPVAVAFYITRYITRDLANRSGDLGKHLYFHSRPLSRAVKASDVYIPSAELDAVCTEHHNFCSTGMVEDAPWYYPYKFAGSVEHDIEFDAVDQAVQVMDPLSGFDPSTIDPDWVQMEIPDFPTSHHLEALK